MRSLAEQSNKSASEIQLLIENVQKATTTVENKIIQNNVSIQEVLTQLQKQVKYLVIFHNLLIKAR